MKTMTPHINRIRHLVPLLLILVVPILTLALLAATAPGPHELDTALRFPMGDLAGNAASGAAVRKNDPLAIEAAFPLESYRPGSIAVLRYWATLPDVTLQVFRVGPERQRTAGKMEMRGVAVTRPRHLERIAAGSFTRIPVGNWPTGLYFARLTAAGGRIGYAPFVVPPQRPGQSRVAVVMPTRTWQAYNFRDDDRDGYGDTWYATAGHTTARLGRPYLNRGVPPHFRQYDLYFLHWAYRTGKQVDVLSQAELDAVRDPAGLRRAYDLLVFPGHHEYVTAGEYDAVEGFRDRGGSLVFLSANNFFWRIDLRGTVMTRVAQWRDLGRPESALLGVQYIGNDEGEHRGAWIVRPSAASRTLFAGTGSATGERFSNAGIEIDHTTSHSPKGTQVMAEIPNLLGPGMTAQMTFYETRNGARVFSAGAFTLAGSVRQRPVAQLLENVWAETLGKQV
jgi:hypothetical protein